MPSWQWLLALLSWLSLALYAIQLILIISPFPFIQSRRLHFHHFNCGQPRLYYLTANNHHPLPTLHHKSFCNHVRHLHHRRSCRESSLLSPHCRKDFAPPSIRICRTRNCPISTGAVDLCKLSSHQKSTWTLHGQH
jgi:hypothetical protein